MDLMETAQLLGNFGEFFGAIAVVVTLAYLAVQLRQNTLSNKSTYQLQIQSNFTRTTEQLFGNSEMCRLLADCREPTLPSDLSSADMERIRLYVNAEINTYAFVQMAHENRQIDDGIYQIYCESLKNDTHNYPALLPVYREGLTVPSYRNTPMFKPLYGEG